MICYMCGEKGEANKNNGNSTRLYVIWDGRGNFAKCGVNLNIVFNHRSYQLAHSRCIIIPLAPPPPLQMAAHP